MCGYIEGKGRFAEVTQPPKYEQSMRLAFGLLLLCHLSRDRKKPTREGYTMDINALNELIARARETVASVVQAEQRVAACTAELAAQPEIKVAPARSIGSIPKRVSGWVPTTEKLPKAS
jgi:hypothetical protein